MANSSIEFDRKVAWHRFINNGFKMLLFILFTSFTFSAGGKEFTGDTIFGHVVNLPDVAIYNIEFMGINLSISKHVVMLLIVSLSTIMISLYATRIYRQDINAQPKGISNVFEII